ncbi:acyl-CoA thioesterase [Taklimakanibacter lacteus]|uniref:acyl-CoA thioesterase n=1 Tax=Taklimakanibacter lacteus TaxID=2268456 RepID=UPI000E66C614
MAAIVTFAGIAHPWMCDAMGHLNTRHYAAMFDDASFQLLGRIAPSGPDFLGWADVRIEVDFLHETAAGTLLTISSHATRIGGSSLTYVHLLSGTIDELARARATVTSVRFDKAARTSVPLADDVRQRAEALISH